MDPVDFKTYMQTVKVLGVPIKGTEVPHIKGGLAEGTLFWLHTWGMGQYDRPEIEIYNVPVMYVRSALETINHWAHYSIGTELKAGEVIRSGDSVFDPFLEMVESPDETDYWKERDIPCLRITMGAIPFECAGCGT